MSEYQPLAFHGDAEHVSAREYAMMASSRDLHADRAEHHIQSQHVPAMLILHCVPDQTTGRFSCDLNHELKGVLGANIAEYHLDYEGLPVGSEEAHRLLGITFESHLQPDAVTNLGNPDALHLPVCTSMGNGTNRIYFCHFTIPRTIQRLHSGGSKGMQIRGRVGAFADSREEGHVLSAIAPGTYPTITLYIHFRSENAF